MHAFDRYDAGLLLGCFIFLYVNLFASPGTPFLLGGDQVFFWLGAQRLLHGEQIYRDFFQFTPPGADLVYLGVFKLFGPRIWTPNLVVLALDTALCALCLRISRSIMSRAEAALATSLFLAFVVGATFDGTHHWFSLLAVLSAVAVLMKGRSPARIGIAGALLGLATFFTQTTGPVAALGIAAWMTWERSRMQEPWSGHLRHLGLLFGSLILTWTALSGYYIATLGLRQLWHFQVTYVRDYMAGWSAVSVKLPDAPSPRVGRLRLIEWLFAFTVLPAVYAICLWRCWRLSRKAPSDGTARLCLLTIVGAGMFAEVAVSPSWFRFFCISLPGIILLVWLAGRLGGFSIHARRLLWIGVIGLAAVHTWSRHVQNSTLAELPAGKVSMPPSAAEKLVWLAAHTKPGQFMLQADWPGMYLPLALRNPIYLDDLEGGADRLVYEASSVRQLEDKRVQYIVVSPWLQSSSASLPIFQEFLHDRYRLARKFSDQDEVWERKPQSAMRGE